MTSQFWMPFYFYYVKTKDNETSQNINLKNFQINYYKLGFSEVKQKIF